MQVRTHAHSIGPTATNTPPTSITPRATPQVLDKHTNLATALLSQIKGRALDQYHSLGEDLLTGKVRAHWPRLPNPVAAPTCLCSAACQGAHALIQAEQPQFAASHA